MAVVTRPPRNDIPGSGNRLGDIAMAADMGAIGVSNEEFLRGDTGRVVA